MGLEIKYNDGQTPLSEEEKEGLLIPSISTRGELDEFEQQNIEEAILWSLKRNFKKDNIFTSAFICELHNRMYGNVWAWAGEFRKTNKNIGVDKWQIATDLSVLLGDVQFWNANNTFDSDETAIRFKHRLVSIHCFANGNGRHSRLMADIVIEHCFKLPHFTWGSVLKENLSDARMSYLSALKLADKGDIEPLIKFARS
jgi:Fic-DOC domain mobile mystery protein B